MPAMPTILEIDTTLNALPAETRADYADVGRHVSSDVARTVARRIIDAHAVHGEVVGRRGFSKARLERLIWVLAALEVADAHREAQRIAKKTGTAGVSKKLKAGKTARKAARALLGPVPKMLREADPAADPTTGPAARLTTILGHTSSSGANPRELAEQLDQLIAELERPEIKAQVGAEEADECLAGARTAADALRPLAPRRSGTPLETERMDVLDGMAIALAREGRAAARVASDLTGNAAIAQAYVIDDLLS